MPTYSSEQMIQAIAHHSTNLLCRTICEKIIKGESSIEHEKTRNHGSFMVAVLDGNFNLAMCRADDSNKAALMHCYKQNPNTQN